MFLHEFLTWQALGYTASSLLVLALRREEDALFAQTLVAKCKRFDQLRASCESTAVAMTSLAVPGQWLYGPHCQCEELIGPLQGKMGIAWNC